MEKDNKENLLDTIKENLPLKKVFSLYLLLAKTEFSLMPQHPDEKDLKEEISTSLLNEQQNENIIQLIETICLLYKFYKKENQSNATKFALLLCWLFSCEKFENYKYSQLLLDHILNQIEEKNKLEFFSTIIDEFKSIWEKCKNDPYKFKAFYLILLLNNFIGNFPSKELIPILTNQIANVILIFIKSWIYETTKLSVKAKSLFDNKNYRLAFECYCKIIKVAQQNDDEKLAINLLSLISDAIFVKEFENLKDQITFLYIMKDFLFFYIRNSLNFFWDTIKSSMISNNSLCRKYACQILKQIVGDHLKNPSLPNKSELEEKWVTFFDIYETMENYATHLTKGVFPKINILIQKAFRSSFVLDDIIQWAEIIFLRLELIGNKKILRYAIKYILKITMFPSDFCSLIDTKMIPLFNDSYLYRDRKGNRYRSKVGILINEFYKCFYSQAFSDNSIKINSFKALINSLSRLTNGEPINSILGGICSIENLPVIFDDQDIPIFENLIIQSCKCMTLYQKTQTFQFVSQLIARNADSSFLKNPNLHSILIKFPKFDYFLSERSQTSQFLFYILSTNTLLDIFTHIITSISEKDPNKGSYYSPEYVRKLIIHISSRSELSSLITQESKELTQKNIHYIFEIITSNFIKSYVLLFQKENSINFISEIISSICESNCPILYEISSFSLDESWNIFCDDFKKYFILSCNFKKLSNNELSELKVFFKTYSNIKKFISYSIFLLHELFSKYENGLTKLCEFFFDEKNIITSKEDIEEYIIQLFVFTQFLESILNGYCISIKRSEDIKNSVVIPQFIFNVAINFLNYFINIDIEKISKLDKLSKDLVLTKTIIISEISSSFVSIINMIMIISQLDQQVKSQLANSKLVQDLIMYLDNFLDISDSQMHKHIFSAYSILISLLLKSPEENMNQVSDIVNKCWNICKNDSNAIESIDSFIQMAFSLDTLKMFKNIFPDLINSMKISFNNQHCFYRLLLFTLVPIWSNHPESISGFENIIVDLGISEEVNGGENCLILSRTFFKVPKFQENKILYTEEINFHGAFCRVSILSILENIILLLQNSKNDNLNLSILDSIFIMINYSFSLLIEEKTNNPNLVPIPYTDLFRKRLRLSQLIYVLFGIFNSSIINKSISIKGDINTKINIILDFIVQLLQQHAVPNVRHFQELFTLRLLLYSDIVIEKFLIPKLSDFSLPIHFRNSLLVISYLMLPKISSKEQKWGILNGISFYMGSNLALTRTLAQIILGTEAKNVDNQFIQNYLEYNIKDAVSKKILGKYNDKFEEMQKIIENHSIHLILSCGINEAGEFISSSFSEFLEETCSKIIADNKDEELIFSSIQWKDIYKNICHLITPTTSIKSSNIDFYQRKNLLWDQVEESYEAMKMKQQSKVRRSLIVVASLIDKIPNLGGLSRTCEIFNVGTYVIPSLKIVEDLNFKSVSVSSENWVPIIEITEKELSNYLKLKKHEGYIISGLEQATNSVSLEKYKFKEKTVLVLGDERKGIPAEILELIDECIEIPQYGVVRSLNVHVSGALCIWQYTMQHSIKSE